MHTVTLIDQTSIKNWCRFRCKSHLMSESTWEETCATREFQSMNEWVLTNVADENDLSNTRPFVHALACLSSKFYDTQVPNMAERNYSEQVRKQEKKEKKNNCCLPAWKWSQTTCLDGNRYFGEQCWCGFIYTTHKKLGIFGFRMKL